MEIETTCDVSSLMTQIESIEGVSVCDQKLICNGKMLEQGSLESYGVLNCSEVQMFLPLVGGGD